MNTTPDSAVEQLTIELPVSVVSAIRAEAMAQGRDAESIAADRLSNLYAVAANEPPSTSPFGTPDDIYAALYGPAHRFERKRRLHKWSLPSAPRWSGLGLFERSRRGLVTMCGTSAYLECQR